MAQSMIYSITFAPVTHGVNYVSNDGRFNSILKKKGPAPQALSFHPLRIPTVNLTPAEPN